MTKLQRREFNTIVAKAPHAVEELVLNCKYMEANGAYSRGGGSFYGRKEKEARALFADVEASRQYLREQFDNDAELLVALRIAANRSRRQTAHLYEA